MAGFTRDTLCPICQLKQPMDIDTGRFMQHVNGRGSYCAGSELSLAEATRRAQRMERREHFKAALADQRRTRSLMDSFKQGDRVRYKTTGTAQGTVTSVARDYVSVKWDNGAQKTESPDDLQKMAATMAFARDAQGRELKVGDFVSIERGGYSRGGYDTGDSKGVITAVSGDSVTYREITSSGLGQTVTAASAAALRWAPNGY
jgi:preprotein translocase subunit YajC